MDEPLGVLVVDKPEGPTSHDVVDHIRHLYGIKRVGHAGTLDPPATGVLVMGLGKATRLLNFLQGLPKRYLGRVRFGFSTTTQDATGETVREERCSFTAEDLRRIAEEFVGEIAQIPPMVSAVRVGGKKLYESARSGEEVDRQPRKVRIYALEVTDIDLDKWEASIEVLCSSGTYVRTIAADIGEKLNCGAHLSSLRRTAVGSFIEAEAVTLESLSAMDDGERMARIIDPAMAMRDFPVVEVSDELETAVRHGRALDTDVLPARGGELPMILENRRGDIAPHQAGMTAGIPVAVVDRSGKLLAVYRRSRQGLKPATVLV